LTNLPLSGELKEIFLIQGKYFFKLTNLSGKVSFTSTGSMTILQSKCKLTPFATWKQKKLIAKTRQLSGNYDVSICSGKSFFRRKTMLDGLSETLIDEKTQTKKLF
jgi:hypothetical protein